ncbi:MAG: 6,7-dimethyl-8-ribityllumazine synthase [Phycisphaeraceae bacterium]|nr:6,7-dimethyl-8-ribityllumazine synthase [Phycisphaeraceae bacterium]
MAKKAPRRTTSAEPPRVAIVWSRYNASVTEPMLDGAADEFTRRFGTGTGLTVIPAPGAFEVVALALAAADSGRFDGVAALGCIIKGETTHDHHLARAVAHGLVHVTLQTGIPTAFGVLTTNTAAQARARAGGKKGNKGAEAMSALLDTIAASQAVLGHASTPLTAVSTHGAVTAKPDKAKGRRR